MTDRPGLKISYRADGTKKAHWVAANCSRKAKDYPVKTVSLTHLPEDQWAAECRRLYAQLQQWLTTPAAPSYTFTGSMNSLFDAYEKHDLSPYQTVKYNTRAKYDAEISVLRKAVGQRMLSKITGVDFKRWEQQLSAPSAPDDDRRIQRSHDCMSMVRRALRWGVVLELPHAKRLTDIIGEMEFEMLPPRSAYLTFDHAVAIIAEAHRQGRPSIALAQAFQFELSFRQGDVIGQWIPDMSGGGIRHVAKNVIEPKRWDNGLLWSHIDADMILSKLVTKTAKTTRAVAQFDLKLYPLVMAELARIPAEKRLGPMIINEYTGLPYQGFTFRQLWRRIADTAGIPKEVQNRDSRAGSITEATDAGAPLEMTRHHSTHKNTSTTARYSRSTLKKTREVAHLRIASRKPPASE